MVAEHQLNRESSRSHTIFSIMLERSTGAEGDEVIVSKLNLVDLAGSERISKTKSEGTVLKEAQQINKSLSFLEQVVVTPHAAGCSLVAAVAAGNSLVFRHQTSCQWLICPPVLQLVAGKLMLMPDLESTCSNHEGRLQQSRRQCFHTIETAALAHVLPDTVHYSCALSVSTVDIHSFISTTFGFLHRSGTTSQFSVCLLVAQLQRFPAGHCSTVCPWTGSHPVSLFQADTCLERLPGRQLQDTDGGLHLG